jgi:hypothetical protein
MSILFELAKKRRFSSSVAFISLLALAWLSLQSVPSQAANPDKGWTLDQVTSGQIFKHAAVGTAVGAGAGVLSDKTSVGRGAVVGGITGAGSGIVGKMDYLRDKPVLRNAAQGAVIGTGAGYALRSSRVKGAVIGAGSGAGIGYVREHMNDKRYRY